MTNNKKQTEINAVEYLDKVNQFAKENNTGKPKQQTAVEWLASELSNHLEMPHKYFIEILDQAKEMEKEQIENAYNESFTLRDKPYSTAKKYYNTTYGGNK
jgi:hypothetical protein